MVALGFLTYYMIGGFGEDTIRTNQFMWIFGEISGICIQLMNCSINMTFIWLCPEMWCIPIFEFTGENDEIRNCGCPIFRQICILWYHFFSTGSVYPGGRSKHPINRGWSSFSGSVWINDPRLDVHCFFRSS